jgi:Domain of unknown function (DUF4279)
LPLGDLADERSRERTARGTLTRSPGWGVDDEEPGVPGSGRKGNVVQVETRVYFAVTSDGLSPGQLADKIGLPPSAVTEKAFKAGVPPRPTTNSWKLDSGLSRTASLEDHLEVLLV